MQKVYNLQLDFIYKMPVPKIELIKGDVGGNLLNIQLTNMLQPVDLTGSTVTVTIRKSDNITVVYDTTIVSNDTVNFIPDSNALSTLGTVNCTVEVFNGSVRTTSIKFNYKVIDSLNSSDDIASFKDYPILNKLIGDVQALNNNYTAAENTRVTNENQRSNNESTRNINENSRVSAENSRVNEFALMKNAYETATHENTLVELTDGRQDKINNIIYDNIGQRMDAHSSQLNDMAISPEKFIGDDFQKLQQALDYAIINGVMIRISKMYNITGKGSLIINKQPDYGDRRILYIRGDGGGIQKDDAGFIFDATTIHVGDIDINKIRFKSVENAGTTVWNGAKIIRINSYNNEYVNVDHAIKSYDRYVQTVKFKNEHIVGGKGWAFEWYQSIDTDIIHCTIENRENGIRNDDSYSTGYSNVNLRIKDNTIQGLSGTAIKLATCDGMAIEGNYIESCAGDYVDIQSLVTYLSGITFAKNTIVMMQSQVDANKYPILVGRTLRMIGTTEINEINQLCMFYSNTSNGNLYHKTGTGEILSLGDKSPTSSVEDGVIQLFGINRMASGNANIADIRSSGVIRGFTHKSSPMLSTGQTLVISRSITIPFFKQPVKNEDMVSISFTPCDNIRLNSYSIENSTDGTSVVKVNVTNTLAGPITVDMYITVFKIYN